jgi:hypothetical protein
MNWCVPNEVVRYLAVQEPFCPASGFIEMSCVVMILWSTPTQTLRGQSVSIPGNPMCTWEAEQGSGKAGRSIQFRVRGILESVFGRSRTLSTMLLMVLKGSSCRNITVLVLIVTVWFSWVAELRSYAGPSLPDFCKFLSISYVARLSCAL